ncbi:MerR family transcriptional regulator [Microbacterium sp. SORGH_AS_0421]|uniref:MerR family transcriptional regulator n=1 Tax=Microbacterium sp. SORGH_AS_0421 TaxID=3041768 RepID=UPI00278ED31E|nr:MerR family transcriptional regulator [Microbacterium sp. SORGH_AS_0421]MDQ1176985.1 DNA-binding transcriptional MerR regulator [Microbacterium sp. SORGH_AS_0421]
MGSDDVGLTVAQMARTTGVSAHTLRYYERVGLLRPVVRTAGKQRRYRDSDVEWVAFLLRLRQTGMPIAQMREYADLRHRGDATKRSRLDLLEAHQLALRDRIAELRAHERALSDKISVYRQALPVLDQDEEERQEP